MGLELSLGFLIVVLFIELRERRIIERLTTLDKHLVELPSIAAKVGSISIQLKELDSLTNISAEITTIQIRLTELLKEAERVEKYRSNPGVDYDMEL